MLLPDGFALGVADDRAAREPRDFDLVADLGVAEVRLPLAWAVAQPAGRDGLDAGALTAAARDVDGLLAHGIRPRVTLGGELPERVREAGGWTLRDTAERYVEYAARVAEVLGDRVATWETLDLPRGLALPEAHHRMLGHGLAAPEVRRAVRIPATLEIALDLVVVRPADDDADEAARRADVRNVRAVTGPLLGDGYPDELLLDTVGESDWAFLRPGDDARIGTAVDGLVLSVPEVLVARGDGRALDPDAFDDVAPLAELLARLDAEHPDLPRLVRASVTESPLVPVVSALGTRGILLEPLVGGLIEVDAVTEERSLSAAGIELRDLARSRELPDDFFER